MNLRELKELVAEKQVPLVKAQWKTIARVENKWKYVYFWYTDGTFSAITVEDGYEGERGSMEDILFSFSWNDDISRLHAIGLITDAEQEELAAETERTRIFNRETRDRAEYESLKLKFDPPEIGESSGAVE